MSFWGAVYSLGIHQIFTTKWDVMSVLNSVHLFVHLKKRVYCSEFCSQGCKICPLIVVSLSESTYFTDFYYACVYSHGILLPTGD